MRGYGQFCPIAQAAELLAERWTLLVVRELLCGSHRFSDLLHGVPLMPRSVLSARLNVLEAAGVIVRHQTKGKQNQAYHLTEAGKALMPIVMAMGEWGKRWVTTGVTEEQLDPTLLLWDIHRRIDHTKVPACRTVIQFEFPDAQAAKRRIWLVLQPESADVCYVNPGYETDLVVTTQVRVLTEIWLGTRAFLPSLSSGEVQLEGPSLLIKQFPSWLQLSVFAPSPGPDRVGGYESVPTAIATS